MKINVIILGAGNSTRMKAKENKIFMKLQKKYVLEYSIDTFLKINNITRIIVVYNKKDEKKVNLLKNKYKEVKFIEGSASRQKSLLKGIKEVDRSADKIIIHDAARPLIYLDIVKDIIEKSKNKKVLIPVRKPLEGVKIIENNTITNSVSRDKIIFCQTPQIFDTAVFLKLKDNTDKGIITFLLDLKIKIDIYILEKDFLKITTLEDLYYYEFIIGRIMNEKD